jgi:hypothetical protein
MPALIRIFFVCSETLLRILRLNKQKLASCYCSLYDVALKANLLILCSDSPPGPPCIQ